jgi:hypothetical protein
MALIRSLRRRDLEVVVSHAEAEATFTLVRDVSGELCLQIDTYGSTERMKKGKQSQSLRLLPTAVTQLRTIIEEHFPKL